MRNLLNLLALLTLASFAVSCGGPEKDDNHIQREEFLGSDDIRETDSYDNAVPVDNDRVMEVDE